MEVKTTLKPGSKGTAALTRRYGDRLICVRYRDDRLGRRRLKTVELIIDEKPWEPAKPGPADCMLVTIHYRETELRERVRRAGGRWNPERRAWLVPKDIITPLGLRNRVLNTTPRE